MHYMAPSESKAPAPSPVRSRLMSLALIVVFDIAGPLVLYTALRSEGFGTVSALVLSGIFPAFGVGISFLRTRTVDALGLLVLAGIVVGTVLGVVTGSPRLVLVEGSVPTAVFGVLCLASLWSARPLIYRLAIEFIGTDSPRGREFESLWQYQGFRHVFRVITVVWGLAFLAEAAARVVIVELTSAGTALTVSKVMPYVLVGVLLAWMRGYGNWSRRRGERLAAQAASSEQAIAAAPPGSPGAS